MGVVDLHLHLLPGIDDGSRDVNDSIAMARALSSLGFTHLAPSPHRRTEFASVDPALCAQKLSEMQTVLKQNDIALELSTNAEHFFLEDSFLPSIAENRFASIGGNGKFVLVEAPYAGPVPRLHDIVFRLKVKGVTPVIAHPERCLEFEKKGRAAEIAASGALFQLDVGALIGRYGRAPQKLARAMLDDDLYAIAATDLHASVKAVEWVGESMALLEKLVGSPRLHKLFGETPRKILAGESV